jgi:hypothetical protein
VALSRRARWLERLWDTHVADAIPYIETLGECWGELGVTRELASIWANNLVDPLRAKWGDQKPGSNFQGTPVCLLTLLAAARDTELMDLLEKAPFVWWEERRRGVRALAAMGKTGDAPRYAEASRGPTTTRRLIARTCEEILLSVGRARPSPMSVTHWSPVAAPRTASDADQSCGSIPSVNKRKFCATSSRRRPARRASGSPRPRKPGSSRWRASLRTNHSAIAADHQTLRPNEGRAVI